ncbi:hypothetical protein AAE478_007473 [Parahypoxylon ruwenzoriense]
MARIRVLINGAGIAGNALAFWLVKLGHDVTIVERFSNLRATGLQIDLRGHGIEVLKRMGLEKAFRERAAPEQGLQIVDGRGRRRAFFAANKSGDGLQSFTSEFEIMRGDLCRLFFDATKGRAKYVFGTSILSFEQRDSDRKVNVKFENGKTDRFDLVVGADGQWSRTRRLLFGPDTPQTVRPIGDFSIAYFTIPKPIQEGEEYVATAYTAPGHRAVMTRRHSPDSIQVYLPCKGDSPRLVNARRGDVKEEKEAFAEYFQGAGWQSEEIIKAMRKSEDFYCEHLRLVKLPAWSRGRVVLVGDAAYCPSANTGMGTTSGVVGAYILAGEIGKHVGRGEGNNTTDENVKDNSLETALQAYENKFRPFMDRVTKDISGDTVAWSMLPSSELGISIMHAILGAVSFFRLDVFAQWFLREKVVQNWVLPDYEELAQKE